MTGEPRWIEFARSKIGVWHDGPDVPKMAREIGTFYPEMGAYCAQATDSMAWCGCFVARCLAEAGIRPQYVQDSSDTNDLFWAQAWKKFGTAVDEPQVGDVLVFARHVTFYVGQDDDHYLCLGGNQSDGVNITAFRKSGCEAIRRPPAPGAIISAASNEAEEINTAPAGDEFHQYLPDLLESEGGNDDNPADPGGKTSRGVLQSEYDEWRQSHPGLPADVFKAPDATIEAIFKENYWDVLQCDPLPAGVDYAVFDYGVNSGVSRAAKVLQRILGGLDVDGEVGPLTIAATLAYPDKHALIDAICDERMGFLQGLKTWPTFGRGWTTRVKEVRALSHKTVGTDIPAPAPQPPKEAPVPDTPATPAPAPKFQLPKIDPAAIEASRELAGAAVKAIVSSPEFKSVVVKALTSLTGGALMTSMPWLGVASMVVLSILNVHGFVGGEAGVGGTTNGASLLAAAQGVTGMGVLGLFQRGVSAFRAFADRAK